jgi:hypothetical protein
MDIMSNQNAVFTQRFAQATAAAWNKAAVPAGISNADSTQGLSASAISVTGVNISGCMTNTTRRSLKGGSQSSREEDKMRRMRLMANGDATATVNATVTAPGSFPTPSNFSSFFQSELITQLTSGPFSTTYEVVGAVVSLAPNELLTRASSPSSAGNPTASPSSLGYSPVNTVKSGAAQPTASPPSEQQLGGGVSSGGSGLSIGAAAGIGVGVAAFTVALIVVVAFFIHRHRSAKEGGENYLGGNADGLDDALAGHFAQGEPMVKMMIMSDHEGGDVHQKKHSRFPTVMMMMNPECHDEAGERPQIET